MKHREGDPWQDLFKEQPLGAREGWEGPEPGSMLGDWSGTLVKGQMQKAQPEEKAMQDVQPSSSLKLSPKPQLFRCMNKHAQLLSAKAALPALPSTVLFTPGRAKSSSAPDGNMVAEVTKALFFFVTSSFTTFLPPFWSLTCFFFCCFSFERLLSSAPVALAWCVAPTDVSFEIEISSCSAKWLT